jgi:hypothetical protein
MTNYLNQHPEIYMGRKEIHFFGSDLRLDNTSHMTTENYLNVFVEANKEKIIGDPSVWYLYSQKAAYEIRDLFPDARILIMLRNPIEMFYSLYYQFLHDGKIMPAFEIFLAKENEIRQKENPFFNEGKRLVHHIHTDMAMFYEQVKRYFDVFGQENVKVIIYDDFQQNTQQVYQDTLNFLKVDSNFVIKEFKKVNAHRHYRSYVLHRLFVNPYFVNSSELFLSNLIRKMIKPILSSEFRHYFRQQFTKFNTVELTRPAMSLETYNYLADKFRSDVEQLSLLLNCDLTYWCQSNPANKIQ